MTELSDSPEHARLSDIHWPLVAMVAACGVLANFAPTLEESRYIELAAKAFSIAPFFIWAVLARRNRALRPYWIMLPFSGIFFLAIASWMINNSDATEAFRWIVLFFFYTAAAKIAWPQENKPNIIMTVYVGLVVAGGFFSLYALRFSADISEISYRRAVEGLHPNAQGLISAGTANLAILLAFAFKAKNAKYALFCIAVLSVISAWVTGSRTALVAFLLTQAFFLLIAFSVIGSTKRYFLFACIMPFAIIGAMLGTEFAMPRFVQHADLLLRFDSVDTLAGRRFTWAFVLENIFVYPIFPIGLGPDLGRQWLMAMTGLHAHNGYLQLIVDLGPFVVFPMVIWLIFPAFKAFLALPAHPRIVMSHFGLFLFMVIHSMAEANMDRLANTMNMAFVFAMVGLWQLRLNGTNPRLLSRSNAGFCNYSSLSSNSHLKRGFLYEQPPSN